MTRFVVFDCGKVRIDLRCPITRKTIKKLGKQRTRKAMSSFRKMFSAK